MEPTQREGVPRHIAIIMDGNGRWAERRGQERIAGHRAGLESVRAVLRAAHDLGAKYLTLYAFSIENWNRPRLEVGGLMQLLEHYLEAEPRPRGGPGSGDALHHALTRTLSQNAACLPFPGRGSRRYSTARSYPGADPKRTLNVLSPAPGAVMRRSSWRPGHASRRSACSSLRASVWIDPQLVLRCALEAGRRLAGVASRTLADSERTCGKLTLHAGFPAIETRASGQ